MHPVFLESYMLTTTTLIPMTVGALIALAAKRANLPAATTLKTLLVFGLIIGLWTALATYCGKTEAMAQGIFAGGPPLVGLFFIGGGIFVWFLGRATTTTRAITDAMGHDMLIGLQSFRVLGGIFLIGWAYGDIPWIFALPAGLGDILSGILGFRAMRAVQRQDADARSKVILANIVGMTDFAVALSAGLITSNTAFQLTAFETPNIVGFYPLVLIPSLLVPLFLGAHLLSVQKLLREKPGQPTSNPS